MKVMRRDFSKTLIDLLIPKEKFCLEHKLIVT
jgi:hypothetical protein